MKKRILSALLCTVLVISSLTACGSKKKGAGKEVVVYFANWNLDEKDADKGGEVASIPWDSVTYINHAFWEVLPADGTTQSSFEQRDSGQGARTQFRIAPTDEYPDLLNEEMSEIVDGVKKNHFAEYAYFSEKYPDVNIMISVGGWSDSGYFSEMAYTEEGRKSFTDSCVELMKQYPWIDGIDIDWEYPGGSMDGERLPEDEWDEGCPIFGTFMEDNENFAALLKLMRETFDAEFKEGKKITACASASTGYTLPRQDWGSAEPYLDLINVMTYDLAGVWDGATGLGTCGNGAKTAVAFFSLKNIPLDKLCIGSPMYGTVFKTKEDANFGYNAATEPDAPNSEEIDTETIFGWEREAVSGYKKDFDEGKYYIGDEFDNGGKGWHCKYHPVQYGSYMYNDDPDSPYYRWFVSYENEVSLQYKFDLIEQYNLAGMIVWESSEDAYDHTLIKLMGDNLIK